MPHTPYSTLQRKLLNTSTLVRVGALYRHYKYPDRTYKVLLLAVQEASEKICVVYQDTAHPDAPPFVRDLDSWQETVAWHGNIVSRFTRIDAT